MSSTDEPYVEPTSSTPDASYEVIQESYQPPTVSVESVKADAQPRASVEPIRLSEDPGPSQPQPSIDYEKRSLGSDGE